MNNGGRGFNPDGSGLGSHGGAEVTEEGTGFFAQEDSEGNEEPGLTGNADLATERTEVTERT